MPIKSDIQSGKLSRRSFIQYSTAVTGGMVLRPFIVSSEANAHHQKFENKYWYQKPVRIMQTVLREIDEQHYGTLQTSQRGRCDLYLGAHYPQSAAR